MASLAAAAVTKVSEQLLQRTITLRNGKNCPRCDTVPENIVATVFGLRQIRYIRNVSRL